MGKFLSVLLLTVAGIAFAQTPEVDLTSFGHPVQVQIVNGQLVWNLPAGDGTASAGSVDWKGDAPTDLRNLQSVILPDGAAGASVIGHRSGQDGLFLLVPTWEGASLYGSGAWLTVPAGEAAVNTQWQTDGLRIFVALWSPHTIAVRAGSVTTGFSGDSVSLPTGTRFTAKVLPWTTDIQTWAVVAVTETSTGWVPSVWTWTNGKLTALPSNDPVTALADASVSLDAAAPQDGRFSVSAARGSTIAVWGWQSWGAVGAQVFSLAAVPQGTMLSRFDDPAFFWWNQNGQLAGQATPRLGSVPPVAWAVNLPGTVVWSSDVVGMSDRWRVWLILNTAAGTSLYRLEVQTQGTAALDKEGDLPSGTTSVDLRFVRGKWAVATTDHQSQWRLDPDQLTLTAVPSAPYPSQGTRP